MIKEAVLLLSFSRSGDPPPKHHITWAVATGEPARKPRSDSSGILTVVHSRYNAEEISNIQSVKDCFAV